MPAYPRMVQSIGAIVIGFLVVVVLSLGTDIALRASGLFPQLGEQMAGSLFALATAYRTAYAVAGSYVTAWLAPRRPMLHALAGGMIGLVLSIAGAIGTWDRGPTFGPHWYPLALIVLALPSAWCGGRLYTLRSRTARDVSPTP